MAQLTKDQTRALFDILTHYETYTEIESFKTPEAVTYYGYPFTSNNAPPASSSVSVSSSLAISGLNLNGYSSENVNGTSTTNGGETNGTYKEPDVSSSPALQQLFSTYILPLPSIKDLTREFWAVRIQGIMVRLADANLSESYDKGAMGARKTLSTAASSVIEMLSRGALGGVPRREKEADEEKELVKRTYKRNSAKGLNRAWEDVLEEMVYGDLVNELFDHMAKTPDVEAHSPAAQASIDYIVMHLAGFLHHIFIRSPDGQYLLKLIKNIHGLIPYQLVKQTLRVGNAATMINGMMKIFLAKLSVTSITNWVGITKNEDDGMNLLQNIISMVLSWDANEFRKIVSKIEKAEDGPTKEMLDVLRKHSQADRKEQERLRQKSIAKERSIVQVVLKESSTELADSLNKEQHRMCLEYYSALLSVRDRDAISNLLCRQPPDLLTRAIKEGVAAYDPMIRTVHNGVSLSDHLGDLQTFITDFIETSTPTEDEPVSVEDYVALLYKNRHKLHNFIHAVAAKAPSVWESLRVWSNDSIVRFRQEASAEDKANSQMDQQLTSLVAALDQPTQESVIAAIDTHASYLTSLRTLSDSRLNGLAKRANDAETFGESPAGPGMYLTRWQAILDETLITAAKRGGKKNSAPPRHGSDVRHLSTMGKVGVGGSLNGAAALAGKEAEPPAPDVSVVVKNLQKQFHELVQTRCASLVRGPE